MSIAGTRFHRVAARSMCAAVLTTLMLSQGCVGCLPGGMFNSFVSLVGLVLDADLGTPLVDVTLRGRLLADGEVVAEFPAEARDDIEGVSPATDGSFQMDYQTVSPACETETGISGFSIAVAIPTPDQVEITITRGTCETVVLIDLNEETVVDPMFFGRIIELRDSILVPMCDQ